MKKTVILFLSVLMLFFVCSCSEKSDIDGTYITDLAYGMDDFYSTIKIDGNRMELYIEHFKVPVEDIKGSYKIEDNVIIFYGDEDKGEFIYDPDKKTIYNDMMGTTWVAEKDYVPSDEKTEPEETEAPVETEGEEPDPIPENVRGEYFYSDDKMEAVLTITEGDYTLSATSEGSEPFEITGDAVYVGTQMLMTDGENSISCPLDEEKGTIEYDGFLFKKK